MGALIREYADRVPYEFDFQYEGNVAHYLRYQLGNHENNADQSLVVIP